MLQFIKDTNIDFLSKRKLALMVSGAIILIGIAATIMHGGPDYSIDFLGGTELHVRFSGTPQIGEIRSALADIGFGNAEIKEFGAPQDILIRVEQQDTGAEISQPILDTLSSQFASLSPELLQRDIVGPRTGQELRTKTIWAIAIALILILIYIWIRFEFVFGIGAVAALFHDVLITFGIFSLLRFEISLAVIAAFLTIVGYSLNDTIVVFDRIRENIKRLRREEFNKILNTSINQSLNRTVITSLTTLLVVLVLYLFGGEVLRNFSFALLVGVIIGTYSSVFIATPIVAEWQSRQIQKNAALSAKKRKK
ncbi:MAG: protein translocase subunit SecF [bacterium]